jgi:CheY-like chemotaxis protein
MSAALKLPPLARRRGRILIVDDVPALVNALVRILRPHHDAEGAADGLEALDRIVAGASYDAILCDMMMPRLGGMALYEELACVAPEAARRMVFMSGGTADPVQRRFLRTRDHLEKPFELTRLLAVLAPFTA